LCWKLIVELQVYWNVIASKSNDAYLLDCVNGMCFHEGVVYGNLVLNFDLVVKLLERDSSKRSIFINIHYGLVQLWFHYILVWGRRRGDEHVVQKMLWTMDVSNYGTKNFYNKILVRTEFVFSECALEILFIVLITAHVFYVLV